MGVVSEPSIFNSKAICVSDVFLSIDAVLLLIIDPLSEHTTPTELHQERIDAELA